MAPRYLSDGIIFLIPSIRNEARVSMYHWFKTDESTAMFIIRVVLGTVMFAHGAQKLIGWFGGQGFNGTMSVFTEKMGLPWLVAFLVIIAESFGSLALIAGFLTRFTAASFMLIMLGAIATVHWPKGFFMNWFGQQQGEGFEYHLLVLGMSAALLVAGGGKWAVDALIARSLNRRNDEPARAHMRRAA
jgi:putative oxidoreductase